MPKWQDSTLYPDTTRDIWIYTPPGFEPGVGDPPALAVFQDGGGYLNKEGPVRAPAVFDSLIAAGDLPPIVGAFVMPGTALDEAIPPNSHRHDIGRSWEYDAVTPRFAQFLDTEIVPLVEAQIGAAVTTDPSKRMICGISSGGICAFNAAWHRPESFGLVLSHCGSYTNIRGGHNIPYLIRTTPRKPIKVFLQSGSRDAHILLGSWPLANQDMASALEFAGYDFRFEFGEGCHSLRHGGAIFGDSLRWLFSD